MQKFKPGFLLVLLSLIFACTKEQDPAPAPEKAPAEENSAEACPTGTKGELVPDSYIVLFKEDGGVGIQNTTGINKIDFIRSRARQLAEKSGVKQLDIKKTFAHGISGFAAKMTAAQAANLRNSSDVAVVEQNRIVQVQPLQVDQLEHQGEVVPYGVKRVGCAVSTGTNKTAWILDTGIDINHSDLNVDKTRSRSFICEEADADDHNGHGTHVAGIIGAKKNGEGIVGVAPGNILVGLKVMGADGKGTVADIIEALQYVYKNARAGDVVNMSLSGGKSTILDNYVLKLASEKNLLFAVAAGNEASHAGEISPQRVNHSNVFTISAMDDKDVWASFSNYGNGPVDFCAPGVKILSTYHGGRYAVLSGTSMAAPHVAGLLLLNGARINSDGEVTEDPDGTADPIAHK